MTRATASISEHLSDAILSGTAISRLFLETPGGKPETILSTGERRDAWFCRGCSLAVVTPQENIVEHWSASANATLSESSTEPLTCLSCGTAIPTNHEVCPACGWSWKQ